MERKIYADAGSGSKTNSYSYDSGNFPDAKTNAREQVADYTFDDAGRLRTVSYSDGTPSVTLDYDRGDRLRSAMDAVGTRMIGWTDRDQLGNESYTNGLLSGLTVTRGYDTQFRLSTLGLSLGATGTARQRFAYDSVSWLDYIADETPDGATVLHKFDYAFKTNTPFVQTVDYLRGTTNVMTQSYSRDSLGRLSDAGATLAAGGTVNGVNYQFDNLDRRFEADLADGSKWNYGYNDRSEVTAGKKKFASGFYAAGQQFEYGFDDIGNRTSTKSGGDNIGNNLRTASYSANALNQLTSRGVPGAVDVIGTATNTATVTVNNQSTYRHADYFWKELTADNASSPVHLSVTNLAVLNNGTNADLVTTNTGFVYLAKTPEIGRAHV